MRHLINLYNFRSCRPVNSQPNGHITKLIELTSTYHHYFGDLEDKKTYNCYAIGCRYMAISHV